MRRLLVGAFAVAVIAFGLAACGGGGGGSTPSNSTTVNLTPGTAAKGTITTGSGVNTLNFNFPANAVTTSAVATIAEATGVPPNKGFEKGVNVDKTISCTGTQLTAFTISVPNVTVLGASVMMDGFFASTTTVGATYNIAMLVNNAWVDVATLVVKANGAFTMNIVSVDWPGILAPGTYSIYLPDPGCNVVSNLGIAITSDDGSTLQTVHLYDASGAALATPTMTTLLFSGGGDLDGQALTPNGSQGILMDGGNDIFFFSGVQTGTPVASTATLNISTYGSGDGDSVAIMPNGDEAVASADGTQGVVVSGILSGTPALADIITFPGARDGVLISNDGTVLLARGPTGLTVFQIAAITPKTGSLGGLISHSFTQTSDLPALAAFSEDGRDGMAISPIDSSRAVVVATSLDTKSAAMLTGLPSAPVAGTALDLTGISTALSVSITPDGKTAIVGTDVGLVMLSGVDTGTLAPVGTGPFAPTYTAAGGSVTLGNVSTLGITLDGKYVAACDEFNGSLLTIPIAPSGFGTPVGILTGITCPANDQMVMH